MKISIGAPHIRGNSIENIAGSVVNRLLKTRSGCWQLSAIGWIVLKEKNILKRE